jgi:cytochrome P450
MRALEERVRELARHHVDKMAHYGGEYDFAAQIAVHYPLQVILSLLGLPESDFPRLCGRVGTADARRLPPGRQPRTWVAHSGFAHAATGGMYPHCPAGLGQVW